MRARAALMLLTVSFVMSSDVAAQTTKPSDGEGDAAPPAAVRQLYDDPGRAVSIETIAAVQSAFDRYVAAINAGDDAVALRHVVTHRPDAFRAMIASEDEKPTGVTLVAIARSGEQLICVVRRSYADDSLEYDGRLMTRQGEGWAWIDNDLAVADAGLELLLLVARTHAGFEQEAHVEAHPKDGRLRWNDAVAPGERR